MKFNLSPYLTVIVTVHGKTRSYLHRLKSPECPCANGIQTVDHLLFDCSKLNNEREKLIAYISREDNWTVRKSELVNKYLKEVIHFSIDYEKLQKITMCKTSAHTIKYRSSATELSEL